MRRFKLDVVRRWLVERWKSDLFAATESYEVWHKMHPAMHAEGTLYVLRAGKHSFATEESLRLFCRQMGILNVDAMMRDLEADGGLWEP